MAFSLGFHILFVVAGMAMPMLMVGAEALWQRTRDPVYLDLAKRWSRGVAILVAVGAVSGTVLSFELGLLWPRFMAFAGPMVGMPFSLEGFAFFTEAIFLGVYLYGWDRVSERAHLLSGVMVLVGGVVSGAFVVCANAWMNTPTGFDLNAAGEVIAVRPLEAMLNPAAFTQVLHMTLAAFQAVGIAVAAIHAYVLLRTPRSRFHQAAFALALLVGGVASILQPLSGDLAAKQVARNQPAKLAAMEAHFETTEGAPLLIGGWPDEEAEETRFAIRIPGALSFLAHGDFGAEVTGLSDIPRDEWPPVAPVHVAFQIMVGCGTVLMGVAFLGAGLAWRRKRIPLDPRFLRLVVLSGPLGFIALEAGWTVTEVGRQPWVVRGFLRTADAVTPMPGLVVPLITFSLLYLLLGVLVLAMLRRHVFASPDAA